MVPKDTTEAIAAWLVGQFKDAAPSAIASSVDGIVFRAVGQDGSTLGEIEVSDEALADHPPEVIIGDLERAGAADHLRRDPSVRLSYLTDRRVYNFESLVVECDGRQYRVVRDAHHNVQIFDASGAALLNRPAAPLVLPMSIHRRAVSRWCDEIRTWRGGQQ